MSMASANASVNSLHNRCVNCAVRFGRNIEKRKLSEAAEPVQQLISLWISREVHPTDLICKKCLAIVQRSIISGKRLRQYGFNNICVPCGRSLLKARQTHIVLAGCMERDSIIQRLPPYQGEERLDRVCMACWLRAYRAARVHRLEDANRNKDSARSAENSSNIPPPPPMAAPPVIPESPETNTISSSTVDLSTTSNYKQTAANFSHCIIG